MPKPKWQWLKIDPPKPKKKKPKKPGVKLPKSLKAVGAHGILDDADLLDLRAGTKRVAALMSDGAWYSADEIREAAGKDGQPASEGLRRARDLRKIPGVILERRKKQGSRLFEYRIKKLQ